MTFKNAYDRAQAAIEKVRSIAAQIDSLLGSGNEEDVTQALALEPALDEAQTAAESATALYDKLTASGKFAENKASLFVPASPEAAKQSGDTKQVTRAEFARMNPVDQAAFTRSGGVITDKEE